MNENNLKERVLAVLTDVTKSAAEKYNEAFKLYRETDAKDLNYERVFNLGFTDNNYNNVMYELQKLHGITDVEIAVGKLPVQDQEEVADNGIDLYPNAEEIEDVDQGQDEGDENIVKLPALKDDEGDEELADTNKAKQETEDAKQDLKDVDKIEVDAEIIGESQTKGDAEVNKEGFVPAPNSEERAKLRDDFPFLNDADCPDELKVLVADKITAYKAYVKDQADLVKHANGELDLHADTAKNLAAQVVENFEKNREIYEELNYYKEHGKILGNHPIFKNLTIQREVDAMTAEECFKYLNASKKFISVKLKDIEKLVATKPKGYQAKMTELTSAIEARKERVALVKQKQGFSE